MIRFTFRFAFMVLLLFFGILMGMNVAEKGIINVAGTPDTKVESFLVSHNNTNQLEVKVMGNTYVSDFAKREFTKVSELVEQPRIIAVKPEQGNISILSNIGNKLGSIVQIGAKKGLNLIASFID